MKPRQIPWKWLLLGLIALLLVGLAMLPRQFGDSARLAARVTDSLAAWTGGDVKLTGPLSVQYFPDVSIKSGFEITNAPREFLRRLRISQVDAGQMKPAAQEMDVRVVETGQHQPATGIDNTRARAGH